MSISPRGDPRLSTAKRKSFNVFGEPPAEDVYRLNQLRRLGVRAPAYASGNPHIASIAS
ncbi:MAG: hypothetical protein Q8R28_23040 [Dehalococcoidia bacterium]|nr:hypothetical protein [Dehalococcoidia bacterium]